MKMNFLCLAVVFYVINYGFCFGHKKPDNLINLSKDLINKQKISTKRNEILTKSTRHTTKKNKIGFADLAKNIIKSTQKRYEFHNQAVTTRSYLNEKHHININHPPINVYHFDNHKSHNNLQHLAKKINSHQRLIHHSSHRYNYRSGHYAHLRGDTCFNNYKYDGYTFGYFECPIEGYSYFDTACCGLPGEQYCCSQMEHNNERQWRHNNNNQNIHPQIYTGKKTNLWYILVPLFLIFAIAIVVAVIIKFRS